MNRINSALRGILFSLIAIQYSVSQNSFQHNSEYRVVDFPSAHYHFHYPSLGGEEPGVSYHYTRSGVLSNSSGLSTHSLLLGKNFRIQNLPLQGILIFAALSYKNKGALLDEPEDGSTPPAYVESGIAFPMGLKMNFGGWVLNGIALGAAPTRFQFDLWGRDEKFSNGLTGSAHINLMQEVPWASTIVGINYINMLQPEVNLGSTAGNYRFPKFSEVSLHWQGPEKMVSSFVTLPYSSQGQNAPGDKADPGPPVLGVGFRPLPYLEFREKWVDFNCHFPGVRGILPITNLFTMRNKLSLKYEASHGLTCSDSSAPSGLRFGLEFFVGMNTGYN